MTAPPATPTARYRRAGPEDAPAIAALHADSWRRHYRGAFRDEYLDGPILEERVEVWTARLAHPNHSTHTVVAEAGGVVLGFVHVVLDADSRWGALLDNLHVRHDLQRSGIGRGLMAQAATAVVDRRPGSAMHLWVLVQNTRGQAFYRALGGAEADREVSEPPGGGSVTGIRYVWPDPKGLLLPTR